MLYMPVTYGTAHRWLREKRGRAVDHICVCGRRAEEWSYLGGAPDEITDAHGLRYSLDPEFYAAWCRACHRKHDTNLPTHCPRGHEFTDENTYVSPRDKRRCRRCLNDASIKWRKRRTGSYARFLEISRATTEAERIALLESRGACEGCGGDLGTHGRKDRRYCTRLCMKAAGQRRRKQASTP